VAPLVVDAEAMFAAGSAVDAAGAGLAANLTVLAAGFAAHTGLDMAGMVFGLAYQDAADALLKASAAAINACRHSGALIQQGAANYSKAEAASTVGGGGAGALEAPTKPGTIAAPGPPGTLGPGQPPPALWALVQSFVDDVWPDGDVAALHAAAARWRTFGAALGAMQGSLNASKSLLDTQQIPERDLIDGALGQMGSCIADIGQQCGKLASTIDDFANEVDHAQTAIRDLLHRLGSLADLGHDVMLIIEGDAIDEVEKIAKDINAVLHNLGREARAYEQGTKLVMQIGDGLVVKFEKFTRREFVHFLGEEVGNPVATVFDTWVNTNEGVLKGAVGMAQGLVDLDPRWFLVNPKGAAATWTDIAKSGWKGSLINALLNPEEAGEANLQQLKSLLRLDDWSTARPGLGFGENVFDVATLVLPGAGEAGAAADGAGAAARGADAAADAAETASGAEGRAAADGVGGVVRARGALGDITGVGSGLTKDLEGVTGELPAIDAQVGGRPVGLPVSKPFDAPVEAAGSPPDAAAMPRESGRSPDSGTAEGPSTAAPRGPVSVPVEGPRESVAAVGRSLPPIPVEAGERVSASAPQLVEHSPSRAPMAPSGSPIESAESAPAAARSSPPAPAAAAHSAAAPHFPAPSAQPVQLPAPHESGWHGPGDGAPPSGHHHEQRPHGGGTHGHGHGSHHDHSTHDGDDPSSTDGLTSDDLAAIADYTGPGHEDLNDALRSNAVDASQKARIEAFSNALQKLPTYQGAVIRGTDLPPEIVDRYRRDEIITEDAFLSATTDPAVARSPTFAGNVEFQITSKTGRDISHVSLFPNEKEIVFPAGTRFLIIDKVMDSVTSKTVIRMMEL
jgi:ADP-ribosyltransferase exoenzyme